MDWDTQPDPFRRFEGAPQHPLPKPDDDRTPPYDVIYTADAPRVSVTIDAVSRLLYYSMALSAWKEYRQARWSLRVNPSSGNLHPTEAYLVIDAVDGLHPQAGLYHYAPHVHGLERRTQFDRSTWSALTGDLPPGAFLIGLSSIPWREAWKYGERAYRYCQHDAGHALAALRLSAATLGWSLRLLPHVDDDRIELLLGLRRPEAGHDLERESACLLMVVDPAGRDIETEPIRLPNEPLQRMASGTWHGTANRLSTGHRPWPQIDQVENACRVAGSGDAGLTGPRCESPQANLVPSPSAAASAGRIIRRRRSALSMDGATGISLATFCCMLARVLPSATRSPWDALTWQPCVHLAIFVHRVDDLPPGLYALVRAEAQREALQAAMHRSFEWDVPADIACQLPLFRLTDDHFGDIAARISCHQDIAGAGAFSLGMIACFEPMIRRYGAKTYRQLFWETGMVGQALYLEAEAAGIGATGIGCYFDDPFHDVLGLRDDTFQSLYHFTVGRPVADSRLTTLPAYDDHSSEESEPRLPEGPR